MIPQTAPEHEPFASDCLIVGAGMAGLACARELAQRGLRVLVLEAKAQVGGRVATARLPDGTAVELGAEFVHGKPPELLALIDEAELTRTERTGSQVSFSRGRLDVAADEDQEEMFGPLDDLKQFSGRDVSFRTYLHRDHPGLPAEQRQAAFGYVEGFNAADASTISARSLGIQQTAEDAIGGGAAAHISEGYARVPEFLAREVRRAGGDVRCGVAVHAVRWATGRVALETDAGEFTAPRAVLTLPLGVLHARSVAITPEPHTVLTAASRMRMGEVCRFSLIFRKAFWRDLAPQPQLRDLSFLFSFDRVPPVWWTPHPEPAAVLTGWVGGPRSAPLLRLSEEQIAAHAVRELAPIFSVPEDHLRAELVACRTHNWSADLFTRGAYSYVAVGGADASELMSLPVEHTLFFAGEHTDTTGHWGTVHGALRSGLRAAAQVLATAGRS